MVLDRRFVAAGDEDEMLDAGLARLVDDVLQHRPVDDRQHFLRHGLGRRQKSRAEAGDGQNGFADALGHERRSVLSAVSRRRAGMVRRRAIRASAR